eukprot:TRINITY_DN142_c0_g1_i1.p1 TRINITY_DN142_c0_g1~~TRINITY_DN142_c0_g1_i1.p1  ORF type:complete len:1751 (+),score=516.13 TRINITY_DN142_c0_g1_i1:630-5255(+)
MIHSEITGIEKILSAQHACELLKDAITSGSPFLHTPNISGNILNADFIDLDALDHALEAATEVYDGGNQTLRTLKEQGRFIRSLRKALIEDDWSTIRETLEGTYDRKLKWASRIEEEVHAFEIESEKRECLNAFSAVLNASNDLLNECKKNDYDSLVENKQGLNSIVFAFDDAFDMVSKKERACNTPSVAKMASGCKLIRDVLRNICDDQWDRCQRLIPQFNEADLSFNIKVQADILTMVVLRQEVFRTLGESLVVGGVRKDSNGQLNLSHVKVAELAANIGSASRKQNLPNDALALISLAKFMLHIRQSLLSLNWDDVAALLKEKTDILENVSLFPSLQRIGDGCRSQIALIESGVLNKCAITELCDALVKPVGENETEDGPFEGQSLHDALQNSQSVIDKSPKLIQLIQMASAISALRKSVANKDYIDVLSLLPSCRAAGTEELNFLVDVELTEVESWAKGAECTQNLKAALTKGRMVLHNGRINISNVTFRHLDEVIEQCKDQIPHSLLAYSAEVVRSIRELVAKRDTDRLARELELAVTMTVTPDVHEEIEAASAHCRDVQLVEDYLEPVLENSSCPFDETTPGVSLAELARSSISLLHDAISRSEICSTLSPIAQRLLNVARIILNVRKAASEGAWDGVASMLNREEQQLPHKDEAGGFEIHCFKNIIHNREAQDALRSALITGRIELASDNISLLEAAELTNLDNAILLASKVLVKHDLVDTLLPVAILIKQMRESCMAGNTLSLEDSLLKIESLVSEAGIPLEVADEVRSCRLFMKTKKVVDMLRHGITSGCVTGLPGELFTEEVDLNTIDEILSKAAAMDAISPILSHLFFTLKGLREMRQCVCEDDWSSTAEVVSFLQASSEEILSLPTSMDDVPPPMLTNAPAHSSYGNRDMGTSMLSSTTPNNQSNFVNERALIALSRPMLVKEAQAEVNLVETHLRVTALMEHLKEALHQLPNHTNGRIIYSHEQVFSLEHFINELSSTTLPTSLHSVFNSAQLILQLRQLVFNGKLKEAAELMDQRDPTTVSAECLAEFDHLKLSVGLLLRQEKCIMDLERAFVNCDRELLRTSLVEGSALSLEMLPGGEELLSRGSELLQRIQHCERLVQEAELSQHADMIKSAIQYASSIGYTSSNVEMLKFTQQRIQALFEATERALSTLKPEIMEETLAMATSLNLPNIATSELATIQRLLQLPIAQLMQLRLKKAISENDEDTIIELTTTMKREFLLSSSSAFQMFHYPALRPLHHFLVNIEPSLRTNAPPQLLANSIHSHSTKSITRSLTLISGVHERMALSMFQSILIYCGEAPKVNPNQDVEVLMLEVLELCCMMPELHDEFFTQLWKQIQGLSSEADSDILQKLWELMWLALSAFCPSEDFENYIELFFIERNEVECINLLHRRVYRGRKVEKILTKEDLDNAHKCKFASIPSCTIIPDNNNNNNEDKEIEEPLNEYNIIINDEKSLNEEERVNEQDSASIKDNNNNNNNTKMSIQELEEQQQNDNNEGQFGEDTNKFHNPLATMINPMVSIPPPPHHH